MSIVRGPQNHRRQAKNYIHKEAQARLNETVPTFNQQTMNALNVDSVAVSYYHICDRIGKPCSCTATQISEAQAESNEVTNKTLGITTKQDVHVEFQDNIFGDSAAESIYRPDEGIDVSYNHDESIPDVLSAPVDKEGNVDYRETALERNNDCGICYRVGHVPGFSQYGHVTELFTSLNILGISNFHVDQERAPHIMRNSGGGEILYKFIVPTYFRSVNYSIRLNRNILKNEYFYHNKMKLSMEILRKYAGREIVVSVKATEFTHAILAFDLGVPSVRANISQENTGLDYTLRDIVGNLTVVLPPTLHEVRTGDTIIIPDRRYVLRVMNRERKITADKRQLEWVAECRIIQPQENLKNIHKSYKLE